MKQSIIFAALVSLFLLVGCDQTPQEKAEIIKFNIRYQKAQQETYKRSISFCQGEANIKDSRISKWDASRLTTCTDGRNLKINYRDFIDYSNEG